MRFQLFDRILDFEKGISIAGVKNVTLETGNLISLNNTFFYPACLSIEALAQLGGWCIIASKDFSFMVVLAMLMDIEIYDDVVIGDTLTLKANLLEFTGKNSILKGEIRRGNDCMMKIGKIVYGMLKIDDKTLIEGQKRMFSSLFARVKD